MSAQIIEGRILGSSEEALLVHDGERLFQFEGAPALGLGDLIRIEAEERSGTLHYLHHEILAETRVEPLSEGSESGRFIGRGVLQNLRLRAALLRATRAFFDAQDFIEIEAPLIVPCPGLDVHLDPVGVDDGRFLITSPEHQLKRLLVGGARRIYSLGKVFRKEELGRLHEPEFTMLEWYRAYDDAEGVMRDTEALVELLARELKGDAKIGGVDVSAPWERLRVDEAFERYAGMSVFDALRDEARYHQLMAEAIEPQLGKERPVFLTHYPIEMASLAAPDSSDPRFAMRFEAYIDGVEICNGFGELTDPDEQRARHERDRAIRAREGLAQPPLDEPFLRALEEGMPPSGGNALGFDRVVMLLLGAESIGDVIALPYSLR